MLFRFSKSLVVWSWEAVALKIVPKCPSISVDKDTLALPSVLLFSKVIFVSYLNIFAR